jgi:hypothetical protein
MKPLFFMPRCRSGASNRHPYSVELFYSRSFVSIRGYLLCFSRLFCFRSAFRAGLRKIWNNLRGESAAHAGARVQDMLFS